MALTPEIMNQFIMCYCYVAHYLVEYSYASCFLSGKKVLIDKKV